MSSEETQIKVEVGDVTVAQSKSEPSVVEQPLNRSEAMSISGPKLMENDTFKTENVTLSSLSFRTIKVEDGYGSSEMSHAIATLHADRVQATATLKSEVKRDPYNPDHSNIGNSATLPTPDDAKPDTLVKNEADPTDTESDSEADNERDDDTYLPENADDSEEVPDGKIKRQRRQQAKDVREFVARLHEKEDERQAKSAQRNGKRESGHLHERSPKRAKTIGTGIVSKLQGSLLDEHQHSESLAPVMPEFTARTQKEQYQKLCNSIPEGSDLRRAKSQKTDLKGAMRLFRFKKIKVVNEAYKLDGMRSALQSFQLTASAWMIKRELGRNNPFGGILADDMGMGKTVMSLACIIGNPPIDIDLEKFSRSTLVITPNITVADQWLKEVGTHLEKSFSDTTVVFDPKRHSHSKELAERPIVITTISEIKKQHRDMEDCDDDPNGLLKFDSSKGLLFRIRWYRIILDEAHVIKNTASKGKIACCALEAKHCWALSGTPLSNRTPELLSYLTFIGCDVDESWSMFKQNYMSQVGKWKRANSVYR